MTTRRKLLLTTAGFVSAGVFLSGVKGGFADVLPLKVSGDTLRRRLTGDAFEVMQNKATELPGSSPLLAETGEGVFMCAACEAPVFSSEGKYDGGFGWPTFRQPLDNAVMSSRSSGGRCEVSCRHCESHLGYVFNDGPHPAGLRYCINGVAMKFISVKQAERSKHRVSV